MFVSGVRAALGRPAQLCGGRRKAPEGDISISIACMHRPGRDRSQLSRDVVDQYAISSVGTHSQANDSTAVSRGTARELSAFQVAMTTYDRSRCPGTRQAVTCRRRDELKLTFLFFRSRSLALKVCIINRSII
uniref:Uncharacterized protein n=1 Tax=Oryza sativa subsp. japonica TaxID=39947 RepID=Q67UI6_ORYSJ|nr:hypothetical protein [Oryza sativa Japonica Group]